MRTNAEIERVVDEYATMLLRVAYSQLNNRAEAEDAVQEVLLKYIEKSAYLPKRGARKGLAAPRDHQSL